MNGANDSWGSDEAYQCEDDFGSQSDRVSGNSRVHTLKTFTFSLMIRPCLLLQQKEINTETRGEIIGEIQMGQG